MEVEKSKKILIFSTAYYPLVGGAEVAVKEITDKISDFQFDLITARFKNNLPKFEKIGNINVYRLGFGIPILDKLFLPFWGAVFALRLNKKNCYNAYWCMMVTFASGAAYIANILKFWKLTPVILTLQEGDSEKYLKTKWFGLIDFSWYLALQRSNVVTVISNYLGERAKRLGFTGEIKIIPNGVDMQKFSKEILIEEKNKIRKDLDLEEKDVVLVTTSRLVIKNGIGDVIKALKFLPENIKFVIMGDGELKKKLENLAKDLDVSERVIFKGFVSHEKLPKFLKACDIFIRPSLSEGMGNSFLEAMTVGLPVITTPVGGIPDFLKDKETGLFCKVNDPESIAEKVMEYVNNPDLTNRIVETAKKMVLEKYDWNLVAKNMERIFNRLINE